MYPPELYPGPFRLPRLLKSTSAHTVPAQKSNISKKIIGGRSLTFSFLKIIRRLLLFARLSYYFTPYNRLTDYSLQVHKLTKSSTLLSFWPAGFILPPIIENLLIYFFQYGPFGRGVARGPRNTCNQRTHWGTSWTKTNTYTAV